MAEAQPSGQGRLSQISWPRIAAEGAAIIASILIAFALDAWWDGRQERVREAEVLARLHAEFEANLELLREAGRVHQDALAAADSLFRLAAIYESPSVASTTIDSLLFRGTESWTYDPASGTLNSVLSSGDLNLIRDDSLRSLLAGWPNQVEDFREEELKDFHDSWDILTPTAQQFVFWRRTMSRNPADEPPYQFRQDYEGLLASRDFAAAFDNARAKRRVILGELPDVEATILNILGRIQASGASQPPR